MMSLRKFVAYSVITAFIFAAPLSGAVSAQKPEESKGKGKPETSIETPKNKDNKDQDKGKEKEKEKEKPNGEKQELMQEIKDLLKEKKNEMKELKAQMKELIKEKYSEEEMKKLREAGEKIKKEHPGVVVLPVENILSRKMNLKFDTPPVIKYGRTLIPVRAISEGFGAEVDWNEEKQMVTITKGDIEIVFYLAKGTVYVNGEEKAIDVPAEKMNNRTIVPLRFIVENLGLKIEYDAETETVEILEADEVALVEVTPAE